MTRKELADAMLQGIQTPNVEEWREGFIEVKLRSENCWVCALGSALVARNGGDYRKAERLFDRFFALNTATKAGEQVMASLLNIPINLAIQVSERHLWQNQSIEEIAAWLKSSEGGEADV